MAIQEIHQVNRMTIANKLTRRTEIRRLLSEHRGADGYTSVEQLAEQLGVHTQTARDDLRDMGAVKVQERIDGLMVSYWTLPIYNPSADAMREVEQDIVESTVFRKIADHVVEIRKSTNTPIIYLYTERGAGSLLYEWISLLGWPEIDFVTEQRHGVALCIRSGEIDNVYRRLVGNVGS